MHVFPQFECSLLDGAICKNCVHSYVEFAQARFMFSSLIDIHYCMCTSKPPLVITSSGYPVSPDLRFFLSRPYVVPGNGLQTRGDILERLLIIFLAHREVGRTQKPIIGLFRKVRWTLVLSTQEGTAPTEDNYETCTLGLHSAFSS